MSEHRFVYIEHTADKGVSALGDTLEEAFESIAWGMFSLMADLPLYTATDRRTVEVSGEDEVAILHAWLRELLFIFEVDRALPVDFHISGIAGGNLKAVIDIRPFGRDIEWLGSAVKAVTYHCMEVEKTDGGYRVQAIVDV
jgi:SHS2 domain-containing protein